MKPAPAAVPTLAQQVVIDAVADHVRKEMAADGTGHDWSHVFRVRRNAQAILREFPADPFVVELAALLHDLGDPKLHGGDETAARRLVVPLLAGLRVDPELRERVVRIAEGISWSKSYDQDGALQSPEFQVVQDADRLEAIGAIGIGRAFAYGGHKGRVMHDPGLDPAAPGTPAGANRNASSSTINHFYEKILLVKGRMNTPPGRRMAEGRHAYVVEFVERFLAEWEGKA